MLPTFAAKFCEKLDASPRLQRIIQITSREERTTKRFFLLGLAVAAWIVFSMASAEAAQPDPTKFLTLHEVKPVQERTRDAEGQPVSVINQVDILLQLPGENIARRMRVPLTSTLFLDPRAPAARTYEAVVGLDGEIEAHK